MLEENDCFLPLNFLSPNACHSKHSLVTRRNCISPRPIIRQCRHRISVMALDSFLRSAVSCKRVLRCFPIQRLKQNFFPTRHFPPPRTVRHGETRLPFVQTATRRMYSFPAPPLVQCISIPVLLCRWSDPLRLSFSPLSVLHCARSGLHCLSFPASYAASSFRTSASMCALCTLCFLLSIGPFCLPLVGPFRLAPFPSWRFVSFVALSRSGPFRSGSWPLLRSAPACSYFVSALPSGSARELLGS
jgi:hypothetical protein